MYLKNIIVFVIVTSNVFLLPPTMLPLCSIELTLALNVFLDTICLVLSYDSQTRLAFLLSLLFSFFSYRESVSLGVCQQEYVRCREKYVRSDSSNFIGKWSLGDACACKKKYVKKQVNQVKLYHYSFNLKILAAVTSELTIFPNNQYSEIQLQENE